MAVQANDANTVIRGAGAALMRSAEAKVLYVGGRFTRLFPGQWQKQFLFLSCPKSKSIINVSLGKIAVCLFSVPCVLLIRISPIKSGFIPNKSIKQK